jgi:hypothetical protein
VFYREAKKLLYDQPFGRYIEVKGLHDARTTGNFEIRLTHHWKKVESKNNDIGGEKKLQILLHSKSRRRRRGDWLLRTKEERKALVTKIDAILLEPWPDSIDEPRG